MIVYIEEISQYEGRSVTLRGPATQPLFADSVVAASTLARVNLGVVNVVNGGTPMGLAAQTIGSLSFVRADTAAPVRAARLTEPSQTLDVVDFEARVF